MKKKEFLTETKRKAILAERENAIVESFAKTFNKIKRINEEELNINEGVSDIKKGDFLLVQFYKSEPEIPLEVISDEFYVRVPDGNPDDGWSPEYFFKVRERNGKEYRKDAFVLRNSAIKKISKEEFETMEVSKPVEPTPEPKPVNPIPEPTPQPIASNKEENLPEIPIEVVKMETFKIDYKNTGVSAHSGNAKLLCEPIIYNNNQFKLFFYVDFDYKISGGYAPASLYSDAEYPEDDIDNQEVKEMYYIDKENNKYKIPNEYENKYLDKADDLLFILLQDGELYQNYMKNLY